MYKVVILLFFVTINIFASSYGYGIQGELNLKKKLGQLTPHQASFLQNVIDIQKLSNDTSSNLYEKNRKIRRLFRKGEVLWNKIYPEPDIVVFMKTNFYYDKLCDAVINYYISTNQDYLGVDIYKKLITKSEQCFLGEIQITTMISLVKLYMKLGQIEAAKATIDNIKVIIDSDYFIDFSLSSTQNGDFIIAMNSAYEEVLLQYAMLNKNLKIDLTKEQNFFDMLIDSYKEFFYLPFIQVNGIWNSAITFINYDKDTVSKNFYYTNYNLMYVYAKLFFAHGDIKRGQIAYEHMKKALSSNANGTQKENIAKEAFSPVSRTFPSIYELEKIPIMYTYLSMFYESDIQYQLKEVAKAKNLVQQAKNKLRLLQNKYKKLPHEYKYIDGVLQTKRKLFTLWANILEDDKQYNQASKIYDKLILSNENIRESLPIKLRRGYFRGYVKDAYLGFIRAKAKIYKSQNTKESFNMLLSAIELLNSRQLKDLRQDITMEDSNLKIIQTKLKKDELLYIVFDVGSDILTVAISQSDFSADISPKDISLEKNLYIIKDKLVTEKKYDKTLFTQISIQFTKSLQEFKNIKYIHLLNDGVVSILPFDIYIVDNEMIFNRYRIDYIATLTLPKEVKISDTKTLLAVANPTYAKASNIIDTNLFQTRSIDLKGYFIKLPETEDEVVAISKHMNTSKLLLKADAKESTIKTINLKPYNYIHFATHGILGGEIPDMNEPALVLAQESGEDSLLTASEIAKLNLEASLVVLSACNSGNGKYFRGEGITGIARAFKIAGSDEVVASLWSVDSIATKKLMEFFYMYISENYKTSEALYLAKKKLQKYKISDVKVIRGLKKNGSKQMESLSYKNPYFWSAFVLIK